MISFLAIFTKNRPKNVINSERNGQTTQNSIHCPYVIFWLKFRFTYSLRPSPIGKIFQKLRQLQQFWTNVLISLSLSAVILVWMAGRTMMFENDIHLYSCDNRMKETFLSGVLSKRERVLCHLYLAPNKCNSLYSNPEILPKEY